MTENKNPPNSWKPYDFDPITSNDEKVSVSLGGKPIECIKIGDSLMCLRWVGNAPDYRKHIPNLKDMEMDIDDVIVCSSLKSGSHWVWEITNMLKAGTAEYKAKGKSSGMMEFTSVEKLRAIPSPRVFSTHLSFSCLPKDAIQKKCKLIVLRRNPKDVMVSLLPFLKGLGHIDPDVQWDEYFDKYLELDLGSIDQDVQWDEYFDKYLEQGLGSIDPDVPWDEYFDKYLDLDIESTLFNWFYYTKSWYKEIKEKPDCMHILTFEELKEDPVREITKLAKFVGVNENGTLMEDIADKCSFKNLKEAAKAKNDPYSDKTDVFYRKGEVGDWKNHFTVAQNEKFDAVYKERMKGVNIENRYTL